MGKRLSFLQLLTFSWTGAMTQFPYFDGINFDSCHANEEDIGVTEEIWDPKKTMNHVVVRRIRNKQCQITVGRTHTFIGDEPPVFGGEGLAPNPFSYVLAGLGL